MIVEKIELKKSSTVGYLDVNNNTKFRKIELLAGGSIQEGEDKKEAYKKLSEYIDDCLESEANKKSKE